MSGIALTKTYKIALKSCCIIDVPIIAVPIQEITPSTIGLSDIRGFGWSVKSGENVDRVGGDDLLVGSAL